MKRPLLPAPVEAWWNRSGHLPLRRRLPRLFVAASSLTAMLSLLAMLTVAVWFQERGMRGEAEELARTIAFALEAPLAFGDLQAANETLAVLRVRSNVRGAWLHDAGNAVRATYRAAGLKPASAPREGFGCLVAQAPVMAGNDRLGRVVVELDRLQGLRQLLAGAAALVGVQLLVLMVSLPMVRRIAGRITGPVTALARTASRIAEQRDYSRRIHGDGKDEVGQAIRAFNEMLDQVQQRDDALENANRTLEERVARRTQELAQEKERAEAASLAKTRFLANMSHELRTPLNAVLGAAQLLQQGSDATHRAHLIETIGQSGANLLALIENVLDVARIESGALTLSHEAFNLVDCVEAAVATASVAARAGGLAMAVVIEPQLGAWRQGDPMRLRQVLLNLLGNAVKFTPAGDVVMRVCGSGSDRVRFEVSDTGVGMDLGATRDIFQPFAQADEATTRRFGGTGLGLTISRELVRAMGGDITVRSRPGQGSTFSFDILLPAAPPQAAAVAQPPARPAVQQVVFFEPHDASAEALQAMLQRMRIPSRRVADAADLRAAMAPDEAAEPPWLLVAAESPEAWGLLEHCADVIDPERVIAMNDAQSHAVEMAREHMQLPRSVLKPVLRAALVSRLGRHRDAQRLPPAATAAPAQTLLPLQAGSSRRLLVVDDDPTNQMIVMAMLSNAGLRVEAAGDGRSALGLLREHRFDLVLMDWQMPDMDGLEVTRRIRNGAAGPHNTTIPVVALTANAFAEDRAACLAVGMNDFLTKPVVAQQLLSVVHRWTAQAHSARVSSAEDGPARVQ
ncbi:response regulator [Aquincola sp. J276]|uniref:response regulator n=1 Tax=Aquincola sp. J276 TaxID=2898432 RepID=UPI002150BAD9|nr:response regulator [Aquincola sp. J276]MCR5864210.1 response regulator [Aquincola sp. J276]